MIEYFCKHIDTDDLNQITFGFIKKEIAIRKKELATEKYKGIKICMDTNKWVLRPSGTYITILVPVQHL